MEVGRWFSKSIGKWPVVLSLKELRSGRSSKLRVEAIMETGLQWKLRGRRAGHLYRLYYVFQVFVTHHSCRTPATTQRCDFSTYCPNFVYPHNELSLFHDQLGHLLACFLQNSHSMCIVNAFIRLRTECPKCPSLSLAIPTAIVPQRYRQNPSWGAYSVVVLLPIRYESTGS